MINQPHKKLILMDFDGVLHQHFQNKWRGANIIEGEPVPGAAEHLEEIRKSHRVFIYSSRCLDQSGKEAIRSWLKKHNIEVDGITDKKLAIASMIIDDRAIGFNGDFKELKENIKNFKPWYKQGGI